MDLIERLRPKWRHPDAQVRRPAIKKLDDAALLEEIAATDPDETLRALAAERAREVWQAVASGAGPVAECLAALGRLDDERVVAAVAAAATHASVREAALARVSGERLLRDVVRGAADSAIRHAALARIRDAGVLRSIAVSDCPLDLATAAVDRIDDLEILRAIAEHPAASKQVRQRARARLPAEVLEAHGTSVKEARARQVALALHVQALRAEADVLGAAERVRAAEHEWQALAAVVAPFADVAVRFAAAVEAIRADAAALERRRAEAEHVEHVVEAALEARERLCARVEALTGAEAARGLAEARAEWERLPAVPAGRGAASARRFALAVEQCEARRRAWEVAEAVRAEREALVAEAEALAESTPPAKAKVWRALDRRWQAAMASGGGAGEADDALRARFAAAGERLQRRRAEAEAQRSEAQQENLTRLTALETRLRELEAAETLKPATARRALAAADEALAEIGPLPPGEERAAWSERLGAARDALRRRLRSVEEAEEWRRWANTQAQEELIARVEALLEANDLAEGVKIVGQLQAQWDAVATATPEKARTLWERFRTARNELRRRCDAYLAENLEKKRALITQAVALADSTAWNETADALRRLQAEWKAIGPVPAKVAQAVWQEFREPCDRFFARRKEHFAVRDAERDRHAQAKIALCEQAEALAESTDWDAAAAALKRLQAEWKKGGAPPRAQAEQLWQRFRAACDRFFERYRCRGELAREAEVQKAEAICNGLDAVLASLAAPDAPADDEVGRQFDAAWAEWLRLDHALLGSVPALEQRLRAACEGIAAARPESLRGTRFDPDTMRERREKLCRRLEALAPPPPSDEPKRSLQEMALALRERLAANTIAGGKGMERPRRADAADEVQRIVAAWGRLGPALGEEARALAARFEQALTRCRQRS